MQGRCWKCGTIIFDLDPMAPIPAEIPCRECRSVNKGSRFKVKADVEEMMAKRHYSLNGAIRRVAAITGQPEDKVRKAWAR